MIGTAVAQHLRNAPAVSEKVGTKVHPIVIPQQVLSGAVRVPAVVYSISGVERAVSYCHTIGLIRTGMTIDCYAARYDDARALASAVREALVDYRGPMGTPPVPVRTANIETEFDLLDIEPGLYRISQQWSIWHEE